MSNTQRIVVAPGHYIIRDTQTGKVSYWQREYHQSAADRHGTSTADYIHAMYFFLMQAKAKNVLMIGCGGGTLATMLHRAGVASTVVDLHQMSFDIAHRYFAMPPEIACHAADGIAWMKAHRQAYDAIILDAFGEHGMPAPFMQPSFFKLARSRLNRGGLFLMNVIVDDDDDAAPDDLVRRPAEGIGAGAAAGHRWLDRPQCRDRGRRGDEPEKAAKCCCRPCPAAPSWPGSSISWTGAKSARMPSC